MGGATVPGGGPGVGMPAPGFAVRPYTPVAMHRPALLLAVVLLAGPARAHLIRHPRSYSWAFDAGSVTLQGTYALHGGSEAERLREQADVDRDGLLSDAEAASLGPLLRPRLMDPLTVTIGGAAPSWTEALSVDLQGDPYVAGGSGVLLRLQATQASAPLSVRDHGGVLHVQVPHVLRGSDSPTIQGEATAPVPLPSGWALVVTGSDATFAASPGPVAPSSPPAIPASTGAAPGSPARPE